ncbi:D-alanyl-D-alanine carboxypeptidase family protein [Paenibacillus yanchengensis]|uniref:serine-type D-Ala-D-Ala carboxypeptidase n=1 Tax=Paenibacillus yanchengensis TaxID=2035833 RepID=A0ABW4YK39_9BACL
MASEEKGDASPNAMPNSSAPDLAPSATSAILLDAESGTVIYEKNSHDKLPPASITKVMTMLLIMESLQDGKLKLTDKVRTSERAASMGGSQIFLEQGEEMAVEEMLKGIALASGNDASVAMAEKIAGTEQQFAELMNKRAKELGMNNTHFVNASGLPADNHYSTAYDIAIMSRELLKHPDITKYTGLYQDYLRQSSKKPFWLVNTNKLVRFYDGADGLKTGYTSEAKYCLTATAVRENMRVIAVVMGEPTTKTRNAEVSQMFDYSFAQYGNLTLIDEGEMIGELAVEKGKKSTISIVADKSLKVLMKKGVTKEQVRQELHWNEQLKAPIKKGEQLGKLKVYHENELVKEFDITSPEKISKANWWVLLKRSVSGLFS